MLYRLYDAYNWYTQIICQKKEDLLFISMKKADRDKRGESHFDSQWSDLSLQIVGSEGLAEDTLFGLIVILLNWSH